MTSDEEVSWCTHGNSGGWARSPHTWPGNNDNTWVHPLCGKPSRPVWEGSIGMPDTKAFLALPPRGVSYSIARIGPDEYRHYTYMCEDAECFAVAYGKSEESVRMQLARHVCPAPRRLDLHYTNKTAIQLIWEELDDTIDAIKNFDDDDDGPSGYYQLTGNASGLAFALAVSCKPYYMAYEDVLRQANRRWRMRTGEIPYEVTPGYNYYPSMPLAYAKKDAEVTAATSNARKSVAKKTPAPVTPAKPTVRDFSVDERNTIVSMAESGTDIDVLAKLYSTTPDRIRSMIPSKESSDTMIGFLFS